MIVVADDDDDDIIIFIPLMDKFTYLYNHSDEENDVTEKLK